MKHIIHILIISAILLGLAFCFGCKEKAEATEPNFVGLDIDWEPDYPVELKLFGNYSSSDCVTFEVGGDNEIVCDGTREKWLDVMYESMSGKEPTEKVTLRFDEPNEPECKHENIGPSFCTVFHPDGYICGQCSDCGEYVNTNEPELTFGEARWEPYNEYELNNIIPTWPDYIELEKDLWINDWVIRKGTKIYFKED